jgi:hypothetical protein
MSIRPHPKASAGNALPLRKTVLSGCLCGEVEVEPDGTGKFRKIFHKTTGGTAARVANGAAEATPANGRSLSMQLEPQPISRVKEKTCKPPDGSAAITVQRLAVLIDRARSSAYASG